jgi:tetratricopeptide (TPR) repeat protein
MKEKHMSEDSQAARTEVSLARAAEELGDFKAAGDHYAAAARQVTGELQAWCCHEAAVAYRRCGEYKVAVPLLRTAVEALDTSRNAYLLAQINLTMGNVLADQELWLEASQYAHKAKEIFEAEGSLVESLYALIAEARCWAGLGDRGRAVKIYEGLSQEGNSFEIRTQALNNLALLHLDAGKAGDAIKLMLEDVHLCRQAGDVYGEFVAHVNLAQALANEGRANEAAFHAKTALSIGRHYQQSPPYGIAKGIVQKAESDANGI